MMVRRRKKDVSRTRESGYISSDESTVHPPHTKPFSEERKRAFFNVAMITEGFLWAVDSEYPPEDAADVDDALATIVES
jgi:hypothetical protein